MQGPIYLALHGLMWFSTEGTSAPTLPPADLVILDTFLVITTGEEGNTDNLLDRGDDCY